MRTFSVVPRLAQCFSLLVIALSVSTASLAADPGPPGGLSVNVVNTPANPVPVTGGVTITNPSSSPVPVTGAIGVTGNVTVTNSAANPVPVSVKGSAPGTPFEGDCTGFFDSNFPAQICEIPVPAGNQLVVQAISVQASVDPGLFALYAYVQQTKNGASNNGHSFPMTLTGPYIISGVHRLDAFVMAKSITWYFDPAADKATCGVYLSNLHTSNFVNAMSCTITGYLALK